MNGLEAAVLAVLVSAPVSAILGTLAGGFATRYMVKPYEVRSDENLAKVQAEIANDRDERNALRHRLDTQDLKRFDWLHQERASVMQATYAALCDLEDARDAFAGSFMGFVGDPGPAKYWEQFQTVGKRF